MLRVKELEVSLSNVPGEEADVCNDCYDKGCGGSLNDVKSVLMDGGKLLESVVDSVISEAFVSSDLLEVGVTFLELLGTVDATCEGDKEEEGDDGCSNKNRPAKSSTKGVDGQLLFSLVAVVFGSGDLSTDSAAEGKNDDEESNGSTPEEGGEGNYGLSDASVLEEDWVQFLAGGGVAETESENVGEVHFVVSQVVSVEREGVDGVVQTVVIVEASFFVSVDVNGVVVELILSAALWDVLEQWVVLLVLVVTVAPSSEAEVLVVDQVGFDVQDGVDLIVVIDLKGGGFSEGFGEGIAEGDLSGWASQSSVEANARSAEDVTVIAGSIVKGVLDVLVVVVSSDAEAVTVPGGELARWL